MQIHCTAVHAEQKTNFLDRKIKTVTRVSHTNVYVCSCMITWESVALPEQDFW